MPRGTGTVTPYRGRFRARASVDGKRISVGTFDTEVEAQGALAAFWQLREAEVARSPGLMTVKELGKLYLDERETDGVHRSVRRDRSVWNARIDGSSIAAEYVDSLEPRRIRAWVKEQIRTPSARTGKQPEQQTVANALNLFRVALEWGVEVGHLESNPAREVRVPQLGASEEKWSWLRDHEIAKLLACKEIPAEARRIFAVAIFTGLRQGEIWGLRWKDVDLARGELTVTRSYEIATKGGRIKRVPLLEPALEAIKAQPRRCSLVFPLADSQMRHRGDDADWQSMRELAGLRRVRFHDLRHTCASHLVQGTWAPLYIDGPLRLEEAREWMGHRTIRTTERYAHLCPDGLRGRVQGAKRSPVPVETDFAEPSGLDGTRQDSRVSADVSQLAEIAANQRRGRDSNSCMTVLQTAPVFQVIAGGYVEPSPLCDRLRVLLESYARGKRPSDAEVVRALADAYAGELAGTQKPAADAG